MIWKKWIKLDNLVYVYTGSNNFNNFKVTFIFLEWNYEFQLIFRKILKNVEFKKYSRNVNTQNVWKAKKNTNSSIAFPCVSSDKFYKLKIKISFNWINFRSKCLN